MLIIRTGLFRDQVVKPFFIDGNLDDKNYLRLLADQIDPAIEATPGENVNNFWF